MGEEKLLRGKIGIFISHISPEIIGFWRGEFGTRWSVLNESKQRSADNGA